MSAIVLVAAYLGVLNASRAVCRAFGLEAPGLTAAIWLTAAVAAAGLVPLWRMVRVGRKAVQST